MKNILVRMALLALVLTLGVGMASATTVSHESNGLTYTMTYTDNNDGTATVTLNVSGQYTGGTSGVTYFLKAIGTGVGASEVSGSFSGPSGWTSVGGPVAANALCQDSSGSDKLCAENATGIDVTTAAVDITFTWTVTPGTLSVSEVHFGALITRSGSTNPGQGGQLLSEDVPVTEIPEPASMILFGSGLMGMAGVVRRRLRNKQ